MISLKPSGWFIKRRQQPALSAIFILRSCLYYMRGMVNGLNDFRLLPAFIMPGR
jgi:hypothetical protein